MIEKIKELIERFKRENGYSKSEDDVRDSYILELLKILGWDASCWKINTLQEIKTGKKPDICLLDNFKSTIFVIETKKPSVSLDGFETKGKEKIPYIKKLFQYCRGEGVWWGMLTNFVEFRIYNAYREQLYLNKIVNLDNLVNEIEFLKLISKSNLISKKGKIDSDPVYYPKQEEIKEEFFNKLRRWRILLRNYLYKNYPQYSADEIDNQTQKILDRLIFIEVCSDKEVISANVLLAILQSKISYYDELKKKFEEMNDRFNSELFEPDLCDKFEIENDIIEPIIRELSKIDFAKINVQIIGEVYENYLGEILRASPKKILVSNENNFQKRKFQGIYYTPDFIVDYIVRNTVGKILDKVQSEEELKKIRVLDPACGSGSFLIRAFDEFYNAYKRVNNIKVEENSLFDFELKKKILLYNLYGVDIDLRAVEICKLNLMIKVLENTNFMEIKGKKLLPNFSLNIRCGNSLLSGDRWYENEERTLFDIQKNYQQDIETIIKLKEKFYNAKEDREKSEILNEIKILGEKINLEVNQQMKIYFGGDKLKKHKIFNYSVTFCEIFKDGGFDVVISNPPYVRADVDENHLEFREMILKSGNYKTLWEKWDLYLAFIEKGINLLKPDGILGMIVSDAYISSKYAEKSHKWLAEEKTVLQFDFFENIHLFEGVGIKNVMLFVQNKKNPDNKPKRILHKDKFDNIIILPTDTQKKLKENIFKKEIKIIDIDLSKTEILGNICYVSVGMVLNADEKKAKGKFTKDDLISDKKDKIHCKKYIEAKDIERYMIKRVRYLEWGTKRVPDKIRRPTFPELYKPTKILKGAMTDAVYYDKGLFCNHSLMVCVLWKDLKGVENRSITTSIKKFNKKERSELEKISENFDLKYILAIINSKFGKDFLDTVRRSQLSIYPDDLKKIPIRIIDNETRPIYNKIIELVDEIIKLKKMGKDKDLQIEIDTLDRKIDDEVYKLYKMKL